MKIKKLSLALGLFLALPSIGLISCGKKKEGYTVKVSVTDIGTARVFLDTLKIAGQNNNKDDEVSKFNSNANGAKITSVKVTYIDEKGKKVEDKIQSLEVGKDFLKTYQVAAGKTIIVTAQAEGTPVGDTTKGKTKEDEEKLSKELQKLITKEELEAAKGMNEAWANKVKKLVEDALAKAGAPGQPAEVTLPTLSITIEKGGETIAAQSVKASKSSLTPQELTKAGQKTTVSATATAVAFEVK